MTVTLIYKIWKTNIILIDYCNPNLSLLRLFYCSFICSFSLLVSLIMPFQRIKSKFCMHINYPKLQMLIISISAKCFWSISWWRTRCLLQKINTVYSCRKFQTSKTLGHLPEQTRTATENLCPLDWPQCKKRRHKGTVILKHICCVSIWTLKCTWKRNAFPLSFCDWNFKSNWRPSILSGLRTLQKNTSN